MPASVAVSSAVTTVGGDFAASLSSLLELPAVCIAHAAAVTVVAARVHVFLLYAQAGIESFRLPF